MIGSNRAQAKGLIDPARAATRFRLSHHAPAPDIGAFVLRYWIIAWDLRDQPPHTQELIPHPCVNIIFEQRRSAVYGVAHGRSAHRLEGAGHVFGIKFKPGGFRPFLRVPVATLTNTSINLRDAFGVDCRALETTILSIDQPQTQIDLIEQFLRERLPSPDPRVDLIDQMVGRIVSDRTIVKVDQIVERFKIHKRALQRLFREYIGVSPKWIIKRYRLHDAADQVAAGGVVDWPKLALELGYFDQAHFINDFKLIVGRTPADYARQLAQHDP